MEIASLNQLKKEIAGLLELYRSADSERQELSNRLREAENELEELRTQIGEVSSSEHSQNGRGTENAEKLREKIDELLAILDNL